MSDDKDAAKLLMQGMIDQARAKDADPMQTLLDVNKSKSLKACPPRIILLTSEGCAPCEPLKADLKTHLDRGLIDEVPMESEEGRRIMSKNEGLVFTPTLALLDCDEKVVTEIFKGD